MATIDQKRWKCGNGHILGLAQHVKQGDHRVTRLLLFRQAIDDQADRLEDVDVIAVLEGTTLDVRCSACGATRSWYIGEAAIEKLLEKVRANAE